MLAFLLTIIETSEDKDILIDVYNKYFVLLNTIATKLLYDKDYVDDCIQDTFVELINSFDNFKKVAPACQKSYISTICRRVAYKINSKNSEYLSSDDIDNLYFKNRVDYNFSEFDKIDIAYSLNKLDFKYREPIIMKYMDGFSIKEISEKLGISENLVLQRLFRGKKILYNLLEEE